MTSTLVLSDDSGGVRVLTMNRPAARNALSPDLIGALYAALREADDDPSVRAVVLTEMDRDGLKDRYAEVSKRNRSQIHPDASSGL